MPSLSLFAVLFSSFLQHVVCVPQAALSSTTAPPQFLQPAAAPDLVGSMSSSAGAALSCGGCYVVADVAGLVWYSEFFENTAATAQIQVKTSNGTAATRTSIISNEGEFTFGPGAEPTGAALNQINYDSTIMISGALLQSPTAYNVFTAYSVTSATLSNGICVTDRGSKIVLSSAYSEVLPDANGHVILDQSGEQSFVNFLGFTSCSGGGENVVATALIPVSNVTATTRTTGSVFPLAASTKSLSVSGQTSASPAASSSLVLPTASAPAIVVGNKTITPNAQVGLPTINGSTVSVVASTGFASPTGNVTVQTSLVPFVSEAGSWRRQDCGFVTAWFLGMCALGFGVYYL